MLAPNGRAAASWVISEFRTSARPLESTLTLTLTLTLTATATATISSAELGKHPHDACKQVKALPVSILAKCVKAADDIKNGGSFHG